MLDQPQRITPTPWQARVLSVPEAFDLFLGGGRGGGKTYGLLLLILRHVETYGELARVLVTRRNFPDMRDFEAEALALFRAAYGRALGFNAQSHLFRFPSGATVQLDQIEGVADFSKFQGKSFSLIAVDEAGQFPDPAPLDLLRSSLRSKGGVPCRFILSANPGGVGHFWLNQRHVAGQSSWVPYREAKTGRQFVTCSSTLADNPHLAEDYARQIEAATATDPALRKAWLAGDWNIEGGAFFGPVFDTARNVVPPWRAVPRRWETFIAGDHGSAAPAVFFLCARSPGAEHEGRFYPRDSIVLFDEVAFYEKDALNKGLALTVPVMASEVVRACEAWGVAPDGVMDDACWSNHGSAVGTLADEYRRAGLLIHPALKGDRLTGWERMRRLLADAGKPDVPGLYISERCTYFLSTVPFLGRDQRRPEDVDTRSADHAADACRYGVLYDGPPRLRVYELKL